jgi:hypothetical protein
LEAIPHDNYRGPHWKVKAGIQGLANKAMAVYEAILDDPECPVRIRAAVASDVIAHTIGKPVQAIVASTDIMSRRDINSFSDEEIQHMIMLLTTEEHAPNPGPDYPIGALERLREKIEDGPGK